MKKTLITVPLIMLSILTGCSSNPAAEEVKQLQSELSQLESLQESRDLAPLAVDNAEEAIEKVRSLSKDGADRDVIDHHVYLAEKKIEIAKAEIKNKKAEKVVENAGERRREILLSAREQEVQKARSKADSAEARAASLESYAQEMKERADKLADQVNNLQTQQTDRGLILTLGDVLFETDKSKVKAGSEKTLRKVADFLKQYPEREVVVEGFTDSRGPEDYNKELSKERAKSVEDILLNYGVDSQRIRIKGYGEEYPVANNSTASGRLQNRRVEIVLSQEKDGQVQDRMSMR